MLNASRQALFYVKKRTNKRKRMFSSGLARKARGDSRSAATSEQGSPVGTGAGSGPVPVWAGTKLSQIQNLNLNSKK